ncbi:muscle M-line assembly protein unc-89-like isoform X1 [Paramisgurnus dabryanus]|uniref:muscle M-line assembly protein unc-89-like isoform X1 n=1 Tax=Paramisgurnus dabryanus TaxID=90735 RepID=UPI0031F40CD5
MLDYLLLVSFSLLLAGVFGDDVTVSVMKGDDVTLNPNVKHEMLRWKFKDTDITTIEQFRNRLNVNSQTGSLTIQNIRTEDTGEYQLEIKTSTDKIFKPFKTFNVTLNDHVFTVSVMIGDSFTLPTGVQTQPVDVKWTFKGTELNDPTITNIRPEQFGEYKVEINCKDFILHRTLSVKLNDKVKSVSGVEGETVTLNTDTQPQKDDVIEWKFKNALIAKMDRRIPSDYFSNERFRDRLDVNSRGSLIIKKLTTEDFGLYDVNIKSSKHIIHKRFRVTVSGVFSAYVTVSVIKGDDVTLNPDVINEMVRWKFKNTDITTNDQSRDRLILENQTGSLTIQNIRTEDTGEYQLEIKTSTDKILKPFKTFNITLNDKVKSVSVTAGETVTLNTDTQPQKDDVIEWKFKNTIIAQVDGRIRSDYFRNKTLRDRLNVDWLGSLIIKKLTTEDFGLYDVNIKSSKHIIHKRFSLTVSGSHREKICTLLFVPVMMLVKVLV